MVDIPDIGPVELVKHRRSRSLKISLQPNGSVRVSLPYWAPYEAAIKFAESRKEWISSNRHQTTLLEHGQMIGKSHSLDFVTKPGIIKPSGRQQGNDLVVSLPEGMDYNDSAAQKAARSVAIRALRQEGEALLPDRLQDLATEHGFTYASVSVRQLKARWGSCTNKKDITLNLFLMQLPWELIDYVLLHELCHTKHLHHGPEFWEEFQAAMPDAKQRRTRMRQYKPAL